MSKNSMSMHCRNQFMKLDPSTSAQIWIVEQGRNNQHVNYDLHHKIKTEILWIYKIEMKLIGADRKLTVLFKIISPVSSSPSSI